MISKEIEERLLVVEEANVNQDFQPTSDGNPALKSHTEKYRASSFILCALFFVCLSFFGIGRNLVVYLKTDLKEDNVVAAMDVAMWQGTYFVSAIIGAYVADSYWGNYLTALVFFVPYLMGMVTLTISASLPSFKQDTSMSLQSITTFIGLYLMAVADGAAKPCMLALGADQFDDANTTAKGWFFNRFYLSSKVASLLAGTVLVWVQNKYGSALGFFIASLLVGLALMSFIAGSGTYKYRKPRGSPFTRICQVIVAAVRKCNVEFPKDMSLLYDLKANSSASEGSRKLENTPSLRLLDKAAIVTSSDFSSTGTVDYWKLCTVSQVEELKMVLKLLPIWATFILFASVSTQEASLFIEQGLVMNKRVGSFYIPPASLSVFNVLAVMLWAPIYDKILTPIARRFTGKERGFSHLQRIGLGLFVSIFAMVSAALVEIKRLELAREMDLIHENVEVPMSILWQVPQYFLVGVGEVFNQIGMLEFFYDQAPDSMRSLCVALGLVTIALGSYFNSFILTMVAWFTTTGGEPGWIPENLNEGHLDRFYWLIAGLSVLNLIVFLRFASVYRCNRSNL